MSDTSKLTTCQIVCWGLAGLAGLIVLWSAIGAVGFFAALLLAIAFAVLLGLVSSRLICTGYRADDRGIEAQDVERTLRQATGVTGYKAPDPDEDDTTAPTKAPAAGPVPAAEPTASAATAETSAAVQTGTTLSGEEELATRKGEWRYGSEAEAKAAPEAGTRPSALDGPRGGEADDLKRIKGVGPKLEKLINEMGFYHFDQIANWTGAEITWVDDNLKGFKGRVSRDNWVEQARILAAGGETEFSHRVDEGDVY
ncbi:MAG TPA: NADH:ubiquinone oxidoreductase [Roseovarius sp.]|nr:NADH:ubiquinone oxidoreductase [Roseovarius sp.]